MPSFIPGLELNRIFFSSIIKPILNRNYPKLNYSAARIGFGSDVLGFDTVRSMDHDWGLRLELFLEEKDYLELKDEILYCFSNELPHEFHGYSTCFGEPDEKGVRVNEFHTKGLVNHRIEIHTIDSFFQKFLGLQPYSDLSVFDWLSFPEQRLLAITSGAVYYDGLMKLSEIREKFSYYPNEIWLYLMMKQWSIIAEEMAFPGRAAELKDELGLQILVTNQIAKLMKLCFLMEKRYAPYSKWLGTAFSKLNCSTKLSPIFRKALVEKEWSKKQEFLVKAYTFVATIHNDLQITDSIEIKITPFHDRPYLIINAVDFIEAIRAKITSETLLNIKPEIGSINQISNETFILDDISLIRKIFRSVK
ncbi:MAG TPA: DUF4037 domain-containing protein [Candidatus Bathyarchaeia archaeon]|nr:DUF4037 domain-containing protein [Candidatus Bathyarchaeia archaeon]